ncbi:hypothetical protein [Mesorhizobium sp. M0207]|uniref:hypothetical protein n=1 Tax=Mesorhizobium sp. M0207 TaxID=2956915 RepID=UPI003337E37C
MIAVVNSAPASVTWSSPLLAASPGEVMKNWRVKAPNTFDREFGFSRMGYEIAAGWGAAMADVASRQ